MISKKDAYKLLDEHLKDKNLKNHSIAVAFVLESLAKKFEEDQDKWFITGLLHDLDYQYTKDTPKEHTLKTQRILKNYDIPEDIIYAIKSHNNIVPLKSLLDKHLWSADSVTGLIVACALMLPEKKISALKPKSLKKKFKSKSFAKGANRQQISDCLKNFGMELSEFLELARLAMVKGNILE